MRQTELELIAREVRARGLHSSWNELIEFSDAVVGGLVEAYQTLLRNSALVSSKPSNNPEDTQQVVRDRLAMALTLLTSQKQVNEWESEVLESNYNPHERETPASGYMR